MDKQKLIVNDRLERIEMNYDKLKAHLKGIEDAVGTNTLGNRKASRLSNGSPMGDNVKMDQLDNQMRTMNDKIRQLNDNMGQYGVALEEIS